MIVAFATQGWGGDDEARLKALLDEVSYALVPFDRHAKWRSCLAILRRCRERPPSLLAMEGTGVMGGLALLIAHWTQNVPYIVSSGDAVGPFLSAKFPLGRALFTLYEWLLYRNSAGFIGWSPYLTGRALTIGG
ncbi:MAG: hypothetical protein ACJ746_17190 [Bryobacteraceae bacterium]